MELNENTLHIFHLSRICGFAPYLMRRNAIGQIVEIKYNVTLCVYSVVLMLALGEYFFPRLCALHILLNYTNNMLMLFASFLFSAYLYSFAEEKNFARAF